MTTQPVSKGNDQMLDLANRSNGDSSAGDPAEGEAFQRYLLDARSSQRAPSSFGSSFGSSLGTGPAPSSSLSLDFPEPAAATHFAERRDPGPRPPVERSQPNRSRDDRGPDTERVGRETGRDGRVDDRRSADSVERDDRPEPTDRHDRVATDESTRDRDDTVESDEVVDEVTVETAGEAEQVEVSDTVEAVAGALAVGAQVIDQMTVSTTETTEGAAETVGSVGQTAAAVDETIRAETTPQAADSGETQAPTDGPSAPVPAEGDAVRDGEVADDAGSQNGPEPAADGPTVGSESTTAESESDGGNELAERPRPGSGVEAETGRASNEPARPTAEVDPAIAAATLRQNTVQVGTATSTTSSTQAGGGPTATVAVDAAQAPAVARNRQSAPVATAAAAGGPVVDGEPGEALWMQVRRALNSLRALESGDQQVTIRLRPAELGSVTVRIAAGEGGTAVSLVTDSAIAALQLGQQRQQLISELEQNGFDRVAVDVGTGTDPNRAQADQAGQDLAGDGADGSRSGLSAGSGTPAGPDDPTGPGPMRPRRGNGSSAGLIDLDL